MIATQFASGFERPLFLTSPAGDDSRLFVLEQNTGLVKIVDSSSGVVFPQPFLQIPPDTLLTTGFEQGLLGLAFHPDYASNGLFYVNYTAVDGSRGGRTKIVEYRVSDNPDVADPSSARDILEFGQPESNHNGGWIAFGPDGYLYIATGDGGGNGFQTGQLDTSFNSQDLTDNLLGKILRLDINGDDFPLDSSRNYSIPATNPFVGVEGDDEIWSYGLRNPWRPSFDRLTGDLFIADVGQGQQEEVNFQPAGVGGQNYGWNRFEGFLQYSDTPAQEPLTAPIYAYGREQGRSITGGYVYRGPIQELFGDYVFGDFALGRIYSFNVQDIEGGVTSAEVVDRTSQFSPPLGQGEINQIASFGEDASGNLYIIDLDGDIFKLAPESATPDHEYLSDLQPLNAVNGWGPFERDRSNGEQAAGDGGILTLNGTTYSKGLGVHAGSILTYALGGSYNRFQADIGIDDSQGRLGSVVFIVQADGEEIFRSATFTGNTATQSIDLDIGSTDVLELIVEDSGDGRNWDHANWADAKLLRDASQPQLPVPGLTRVEGEEMDIITGFRVETIESSSGGAALSLANTGGRFVGNAAFRFEGASGAYDLVLGSYDENDGEASFIIDLNGTDIATIVLDSRLGSAAPSLTNQVSIPFASGLELRPGDTLGIEALRSRGEYARLDYIDFIPSTLV